MLLRTLLIILLISCLAESACPPPEKIYPFCTCREEDRQSSMTCRNMQSFEDLLLPIQATVRRDMFSLHIINSSLLYIPNGLFQETNFKEIYLIQTEFTSFSDTDIAFDGLENTLTKISISGSKYVAQWEWSQLRNLQRIESITINSTSMYSIDQTILVPNIIRLAITQSEVSFIYDEAFQALNKLLYMTLNENNIKVLKRSMFPKPCRLQLLDLRKNQLRYLPGDLFEDMPEFLILRLDENQFVTLNEKEFSLPMSKLAWFFMADNPLKCDCRMRWIVKSRKPPLFTASCSLPENLKGVNVKDLTVNQLWC
ncbi:slit homolog 3 protein-like [Stegodyphus dumicola]|uniref:slit homolog 3 protein-like n=1 Tax=Stegodyphus dumicola TaxID=202533 RepID=UPI0015AD837C|nr:slit homolog 3 protein-like [Stegodyphus dumicola]